LARTSLWCCIADETIVEWKKDAREGSVFGNQRCAKVAQVGIARQFSEAISHMLAESMQQLGKELFAFIQFDHH